MTLVPPRPRMRTLDRAECIERLNADVVGRLAVVRGDTPLIFPVNYVFDGSGIVLRTGIGSKLAAGRGSRASFEVDSVDRATRQGWSVVVTGWLEEVTGFDAATWARVSHLDVEPWAGGDKSHWLRLTSERVTGRSVEDPR